MADERFTLFNGDGIEMLRKQPDNSVHLILTDPPYGIEYGVDDLASRRRAVSGKKGPPIKHIPITNDEAEAAIQLLDNLCIEAKRVLVSGGILGVCALGGGPSIAAAKWMLLMDKHLTFKHKIIWHKGISVATGWHYRRAYENILIAQKGSKCNWYYDGRQITDVITDIPPMTIGGGAHHPTEKPWRLMARFIRLHTRPDDLVADPFMGSGSTGIAAARMGCRFIGAEINPNFFRIASTRIKEAYSQGELFRAPSLKIRQTVLLEENEVTDERE